MPFWRSEPNPLKKPGQESKIRIRNGPRHLDPESRISHRKKFYFSCLTIYACVLNRTKHGKLKVLERPLNWLIDPQVVLLLGKLSIYSLDFFVCQARRFFFGGHLNEWAPYRLSWNGVLRGSRETLWYNRYVRSTAVLGRYYFH